MEVVGREGRVEITAAKPRTLLAILLLNANQSVAADRLIEMLWDDPPASAAKVLQAYVSQLRRALGADRISTVAGGYTLHVGETELDSARFEALVAAARPDESPAVTRRELTRALGLWRGAAYADFRYDDFARAEAERLEELRLAALEKRIEADLALGRHEDAIPEIRVLARDHPARERLWRLAMLALYRAGRHAEALDVYRDARRSLLDELGLEPSEELRELERAILRQDAALAAPERLGPPTTRVPEPATSLIGRKRELAELRTLVRDERLVTIVGAGGAGKTRLAIEVARELDPEHADGAFFVALAPVRDVAAVPGVLASVLGAEIAAGETQIDAAARHLRAKELLVVLDNAEHVRDFGPLLVDLLATASRLRVLVTSRAVLRLSGERVYALEPLEADDAARLFLTRARAADPSFSVGQDLDVVDDVCSRLDRLPLAIELAAPRVRALELAAIRERLAESLPFLTRGPRDLPVRQQTLRATLDWSYSLLDENAQRMLGDVSVFVGGFTLEGAQAVSSRPNALELIETLLETSMLRRRSAGRFELLETIREYALTKLGPRERDARRAHAEHILAIARSANLTIEADGEMRHALVLPERDNIREALRWALDNDVELGLMIATALENYWITGGDPHEGRRWLGELRERAEDVPATLRALALRVHGNALVITDRTDEGRRLYEASLEEYRRVGDERGVGVMLQRLAGRAADRGDLPLARELAEESLRIVRATGHLKAEAVALSVLATVEFREDHRDRALELWDRSAELARATGFSWWSVAMSLVLARRHLEDARVDDAEARTLAALATAAEMEDRSQIVEALAVLAQTAASRGDTARAGFLWGAVEAEEARAPLGQWARLRALIEPLVLTSAGPEFDRAREAGLRTSLAEALSDTLDT